MKRFVLFAGDCYYPSGGWGDHVSSFDDLPSAIATGMSCLYDNPDYRWAHVVDLTIGETVWEI